MKATVQDTIARVARHYDGALPKYDKISLMDLAHSLRVISESKAEVQEWVLQSGIKLRLPVPMPLGRAVKSLVRKVPFYFIPMASGVPTEPIAMGPMAFIPNSASHVSDADHQRLMHHVRTRQIRHCANFEDWMNHWVVHGGHPNPDGTYVTVQISRQMMIERVSNLLGGSHPPNDPAGDSNRFDPYVRMLHEIAVANGAPLTYYQLLESRKGHHPATAAPRSLLIIARPRTHSQPDRQEAPRGRWHPPKCLAIRIISQIIAGGGYFEYKFPSFQSIQGPSPSG